VNIELLQPKPDDIPALRRLMQLYLYDLGSLDRAVAVSGESERRVELLRYDV
jgi:hypothetical protein